MMPVAELVNDALLKCEVAASTTGFGQGMLTGLAASFVIIVFSGRGSLRAPRLTAHIRVLYPSIALIILGTLGFHYFDGQRWVDAVYCACITLCTVGYGDICPAKKSLDMKVFVAALALCGLGIFTGPFLDLMAEWRVQLYKGPICEIKCAVSAILLMFAVSVGIFATLEGWAISDAIYFVVITGTTIGYGDHPAFKTDSGKLAAASLALLSINVIGFVSQTIGDVLKHKIFGGSAGTLSNGALFVATCGLMILGTIGFCYLDGQHWIDATYCAGVTLTTVGYGDICPATKSNAMKWFVVVFAFCGLAFFGEMLSAVGQWRQFVFKPSRLTRLSLFASLGVVFGAGIGLFIFLEGWTISEALYFAVVTSTTIGYGDQPPFKTDAGKLAAVVFAVLSIDVMSAVTNAIGKDLTMLFDGSKVKEKTS